MSTHGNKWVGEAAVQEEGCRALCNAAFNSNNQEKLIAIGAHDAVREAMAAYPERMDLQEIGCCFIGNVTTENDEAKKKLGPMTGLVLAALGAHPTVADLQEEGWRALIGLVQEKENRSLAISEGGLKVIVDVMRDTDDASILRFGCLALLQLVKDNEVRKPVVDLGATPILAAGIKNFPDDAGLQEVGNKLMKKLGRA